MGMKFPKASELEPHHQMQFSVIYQDTRWGKSYTTSKMESAD